jgi:hypothetical protein
MKLVTITWKAFGKPADATIMFDIDGNVSDLQLCEALFASTNTRSGWMWDAIQRFMPAVRTHTALSVGDEIDIDGSIYRCAGIGWEHVTTYTTDNFVLSERDR